MSADEVTVQAQSSVLGLTAGQTVTVERTDHVQVHIDSGHLAVIDPDADAPDADAPADGEQGDGGEDGGEQGEGDDGS